MSNKVQLGSRSAASAVKSGEATKTSVTASPSTTIKTGPRDDKSLSQTSLEQSSTESESRNVGQAASEADEPEAGGNVQNSPAKRGLQSDDGVFATEHEGLLTLLEQANAGADKIAQLRTPLSQEWHASGSIHLALAMALDGMDPKNEPDHDQAVYATDLVTLLLDERAEANREQAGRRPAAMRTTAAHRADATVTTTGDPHKCAIVMKMVVSHPRIAAAAMMIVVQCAADMMTMIAVAHPCATVMKTGGSRQRRAAADMITMIGATRLSHAIRVKMIAVRAVGSGIPRVI